MVSITSAEILATHLDDSRTHHFQLGLAKVFTRTKSNIFKFHDFYNGGARQNFQKYPMDLLK